ncbi:MAG: alcohol dehydrogenase catalytic domain-containing protein [Methanobrevibacter sp.]
MINTVCRLVSPKLFEEIYIEVDIRDKVIIRPNYLSICRADQRYYQGKRSASVLSKKLPMALTHEATGVVVKDLTGHFNVGDRVVVIPNTPVEKDDIISENYLSSSKFSSSGSDGFMEDYIIVNPDRVVKVPDDLNPEIASFTEFISVAVHGIRRFNRYAHERRDVIGVWGDGNLGYVVALVLKIAMPKSKVFVFGPHLDKLNLFTFADKRFLVDNVPKDVRIDHGFECVGGQGSQSAINQMIDLINPEGTILLMGVSEYPIPINTRDVLSKGLSVIGASRSGRDDFLKTVELYGNTRFLSYLESIIGEVITVRSLDDIHYAFNRDTNLRFGKTILKWEK